MLDSEKGGGNKTLSQSYPQPLKSSLRSEKYNTCLPWIVISTVLCSVAWVLLSFKIFAYITSSEACLVPETLFPNPYNLCKLIKIMAAGLLRIHQGVLHKPRGSQLYNMNCYEWLGVMHEDRARGTYL